MERLVTCKIPVSDPILLNSFNLSGNPNKVTEKDSILTAVIMEKLKKAGEARSELVENLLRTEILKFVKACLQTNIPSITARNRM